MFGRCSLFAVLFVLGCAPPEEASLRPFHITTSLERFDPAAKVRVELPSPGVARAEGAVVAVGDALYLLGGWDEQGALSAAFEVFEPAAARWRRLADWPTPRLGPQLVEADGRLCAGQGFAGLEGSQLAYAIDCFDLGTESWVSLPSAPQPVRSRALAFAAGRLVIIGGYDVGAGSWADRSVAWDFAAQTWRTLPPLGKGFAGARAAVAGELVVVAGEDGSPTAFVAFDAAAEAWRALPGPPFFVSTPAALLVPWTGGVAYGFAEHYPVAGELAWLDPTAPAWAHTQPLPAVGLPVGYAAAVAGANLYVELGAVDVDGRVVAADQLWTYDLVLDAWRLVTSLARDDASTHHVALASLGDSPYILGDTVAIVLPASPR